MQKKLFGLDIGKTTIRAVEIEYVEKQPKVGSGGLIPAPPRGLASESEVDLQLLASTIKRLTETSKIEGKFVVSALPENDVFTRVIQMPYLTDKELASAIRWEGEQYIPSPLSSVSLDWEVIRRDKVGNRMDVLLVGAPTALIAKYQKVLSLAGLEPVYLETEIIAASRSLVDETQDFATIIINMASNFTDLGIVKGGKNFGTYTIPTGGDALTRSVATEFNLDPSQAEEYKKTYGLDVGQFGGKIAASLRPVLLSIVTEIKKTINLYVSKNPQDGVRRLVLCGGGARMPGLPIFFAQALGVEVEVGNPWKKVQIDPNKFPALSQEAPAFAVAAGLALRQ